jgi:hypothetical protein
MMKAKWMKLAANLLEIASDQFSNHGCNDYELPGDWTPEERMELAKAYCVYNKEEADQETLEFLAGGGLGDDALMGFLADEMRRSAGA